MDPGPGGSEDPDHDHADMVSMPRMTPELVLGNIERRFGKNKIYTNVSEILISLNPYREISGLYGISMYDKYHYQTPESSISELPPHIFAVARRAFKGAIGDGIARSDQSILISGESGAGKTEATKQCLQYFVTMCTKLQQSYKVSFTTASHAESSGLEASYTELDEIEDAIMSANPLLEAFGNAKTLRNDNSSRFGKWVSLKMDGRGLICGGNITKYLLEESRVVGQGEGERNFNIFYQVMAGSSNADQYDPGKFHYTSKSGCTTVGGVSDKQMFGELVESFRCLGVNQGERTMIFNIVKGILHLGNIEFEHFQAPSSKRPELRVDDATRDSLKNVVELLLVQKTAVQSDHLLKIVELERQLCNSIMTSPTGSIYVIPRTQEAAHAVRDSLAKLIYSKLFDYLVTRVNQAISHEPDKAKHEDAPALPDITRKVSSPERLKRTVVGTTTTVGILDIFGFEMFEVNGFEQLCINYANEKLQNYFLNILTKQEILLYQTEGLQVESMEFHDNQACVDLLDKAGGVISLLQDELRLPDASDASYLQKLCRAHEHHPYFEKPNIKTKHQKLSFSIKHYPSPVEHKIGDGFPVLFRASQHSVVSELFTMESENQKASRQVKKLSIKSLGRGPRHSTTTNKDNAKSTAEQFRRSLSSLLTSIRATFPHFIRCIKPNPFKRPKEFDRALVKRQLETSGVMDAVVIRQRGYSERFQFEDFVRNYKFMFESAFSLRGGREEFKAATSAVNKCLIILKYLGIPQKEGDKMPNWQKGRDRMFLKNNVYIALEAKREEIRERACITIQRVARGMLTRRLLGAQKLILVEIGRCLAEKDWNGLDEAVEAGQQAALPQKKLQDALETRVRITQIMMAELALIKCMTMTAVVSGEIGLGEHLRYLREKIAEAQQIAVLFGLEGRSVDQKIFASLADSKLSKAPILVLLAVSAQNLCSLLDPLTGLLSQDHPGEQQRLERLERRIEDTWTKMTEDFDLISSRAKEEDTKFVLDSVLQSIKKLAFMKRVQTMRNMVEAKQKEESLRQKVEEGCLRRNFEMLAEALETCKTFGLMESQCAWLRKGTVCASTLEIEKVAVKALAFGMDAPSDDNVLEIVQGALDSVGSILVEENAATVASMDEYLASSAADVRFASMEDIHEQLEVRSAMVESKLFARHQMKDALSIGARGTAHTLDEALHKADSLKITVTEDARNLLLLLQSREAAVNAMNSAVTGTGTPDFQIALCNDAVSALKKAEEASAKASGVPFVNEEWFPVEKALSVSYTMQEAKLRRRLIISTSLEASEEALGKLQSVFKSTEELKQKDKRIWSEVMKRCIHRANSRIKVVSGLIALDRVISSQPEEDANFPQVQAELNKALASGASDTEPIIERAFAMLKNLPSTFKTEKQKSKQREERQRRRQLAEQKLAEEQQEVAKEKQQSFQLKKREEEELLKKLELETIAREEKMKVRRLRMQAKREKNFTSGKFKPKLLKALASDSNNDVPAFQKSIERKEDAPASAVELDAQEIARRAKVLNAELERLQPLAQSTKIFGGLLPGAIACSPYSVPLVVYMCAENIRQHGMEMTGLFRIPGQNDVVALMQDQFEQMSLAAIKMDEVNNVASLLKLYFRKMAQPLVPFSHYEFFLEAAEEKKAELAIEKFRILIASIPAENKTLLGFLVQFLHEVSTHSAKNKMTAKNLAIVFAPNLLQPAVQTNMAKMASDMDRSIVAISTLISHSVELFPETVSPDHALYSQAEPKSEEPQETTETLTPSHQQRAVDTSIEPNAGTLHVIVHGASNLMAASHGSSNPHVSVQVARKKKKQSTAVHSSTLNPEFAESFSFKIDFPLKEVLKISVHSDDANLGNVVFAVGQIARHCLQRKGNKQAGHKIHKIFPLKNAAHGEIDVSLYFEELEHTAAVGTVSRTGAMAMRFAREGRIKFMSVFGRKKSDLQYPLATSRPLSLLRSGFLIPDK